MKPLINIEYSDISVIIDFKKAFISFDQRYAVKGYPIPCEMFFKPSPEILNSINTSGEKPYGFSTIFVFIIP